jgi:hypothetical protein
MYNQGTIKEKDLVYNVNVSVMNYSDSIYIK